MSIDTSNEIEVSVPCLVELHAFVVITFGDWDFNFSGFVGSQNLFSSVSGTAAKKAENPWDTSIFIYNKGRFEGSNL